MGSYHYSARTRVVITAFVVLIAAVAAGVGCHRTDLHQTLKQNLRPAEGSPMVLAVYEPWFGDHEHMDVGYSTHDRVVLGKQVDQAQNLGISAFVVDWYGKRKTFLDASFAILQQTALGKGFKVALMYDEPESAEDPTTSAVASLDYAYEQYIGPHAANREAYLTYQGRPVLFVWPRSKDTDWKAVRQHLQGWESPPIMFMEDGSGKWAEVFDGFYAWVQPGDKGWSRDGSNWGQEYLEGFYKKMKQQYPNKLAIGAAWPGFDDRKASWSENRFMDARCGKTFEDSLRLWRRFYTSSDPLPFLLVVTWNDYEEGTAIERGTGNCAARQQNQAVTSSTQPGSSTSQ
jgi:hypothetical protein